MIFEPLNAFQEKLSFAFFNVKKHAHFMPIAGLFYKSGQLAIKAYPLLTLTFQLYAF